MSFDEIERAVIELYKVSKYFAMKHVDQFLLFVSIAWTYFTTPSPQVFLAYMSKVIMLGNKAINELVGCT